MRDRYGIDVDNLPFKNGDTVVIPQNIDLTIRHWDYEEKKVKYKGKKATIRFIQPDIIEDHYFMELGYIDGWEERFDCMCLNWVIADFVTQKTVVREVKLKKSNKDLLGL